MSCVCISLTVADLVTVLEAIFIGGILVVVVTYFGGNVSFSYSKYSTINRAQNPVTSLRLVVENGRKMSNPQPLFLRVS